VCVFSSPSNIKMNESRKAACKLPHNIRVKETRKLTCSRRSNISVNRSREGEVAYETISR
jgi:hypothetical protein